MMINNKFNGRGLAILLLALTLAPGHAFADVAQRSRIDQAEVAGMTLGTSAREAFNRLKAEGFATGDLETYDDWWQSGLNAVKGENQAPDGYFEIVLTRNGDRLVEIREHRIRLASPFDIAAEIAGAQEFFGVDPETSKTCKIGTCGVEDAEQTAAFLLQFVGDRQRYRVVQRLDLQPENLRDP